MPPDCWACLVLVFVFFFLSFFLFGFNPECGANLDTGPFLAVSLSPPIYQPLWFPSLFFFLHLPIKVWLFGCLVLIAGLETKRLLHVKTIMIGRVKIIELGARHTSIHICNFFVGISVLAFGIFFFFFCLVCLQGNPLPCR